MKEMLILLLERTTETDLFLQHPEVQNRPQPKGPIPSSAKNQSAAALPSQLHSWSSTDLEGAEGGSRQQEPQGMSC